MAKRNPGALGTLLELGVVGGLLYVGYKVVGDIREVKSIPMAPAGNYGYPVANAATGGCIDSQGNFRPGGGC